MKLTHIKWHQNALSLVQQGDSPEDIVTSLGVLVANDFFISAASLSSKAFSEGAMIETL